MARIRTIKPEFPQSESMGRVSRDARLLFVQLWTICDDSGITRGASRMLASLLFPYDDDAPGLIDGWVDELEREGCIVRYEADGSTYIKVQKWAEHQRIDKPSASKFPQFVEGSRVFPESSRKVVQDQGPRTKEGTKDQGGEAREEIRDAETQANPSKAISEKSKGTRWHPDNVVPDEWIDAAIEARSRAGLGAIDMRHEVAKFGHYWSSTDCPKPLKKDWRQTFVNWAVSSKGKQNGTGQHGSSVHPLGVFGAITDRLREAESRDG